MTLYSTQLWKVGVSVHIVLLSASLLSHLHHWPSLFGTEVDP